MLGLVHGHVGTGHFGIAKTLNRLRELFYWPNCSTDSELFVHMCDVCMAQTGPTQRQRAPLQDFRVGGPVERVGIDMLGPFPLSDRGNCYILVAMDYFANWQEVYAVPDQSTATTVRVLVDKSFCRFSASEELHSDQGRNFEVELFSAVCARLGITKTRTTLLHPQSDGLVVHFNWKSPGPVVIQHCSAGAPDFALRPHVRPGN